MSNYGVGGGDSNHHLHHRQYSDFGTAYSDQQQQYLQPDFNSGLHYSSAHQASSSSILRNLRPGEEYHEFCQRRTNPCCLPLRLAVANCRRYVAGGCCASRRPPRVYGNTNGFSAHYQPRQLQQQGMPPGLDQQLLSGGAGGSESCGEGGGNVHNGFAKWPQPQPPPPLPSSIHEIRPYYPETEGQQPTPNLIEVGGNSSDEDSPPYLPAAGTASTTRPGSAAVDFHGVMPSAPSPLDELP